MANRQQCTPDPNPTTPYHPLTPTGWEESAGFRETFLYHFYQPQDAAALRHLQGFLAAIARSPEEAALSSDDTTLAVLAGRHALALAALATALELALG